MYSTMLCHLNGDYYIKDIMMRMPIQRDLSLFQHNSNSYWNQNDTVNIYREILQL